MASNTIKVILSANPLKDWAKEQTQDVIQGALAAVGDALVQASFDIALIGGGISILLWLSGWKNGNRWAGILFMAHVLIKFLIGGA